jgi:hypothetical protein
MYISIFVYRSPYDGTVDISTSKVDAFRCVGSNPTEGKFFLLFLFFDIWLLFALKLKFFKKNYQLDLMTPGNNP